MSESIGEHLQKTLICLLNQSSISWKRNLLFLSKWKNHSSNIKALIFVRVSRGTFAKNAYLNVESVKPFLLKKISYICGSEKIIHRILKPLFLSESIGEQLQKTLICLLNQSSPHYKINLLFLSKWKNNSSKIKALILVRVSKGTFAKNAHMFVVISQALPGK